MSSRSIVRKWSGLDMIRSPCAEYFKINFYKHMSYMPDNYEVNTQRLMVVYPKRIALKFRVACCREELHFVQGGAPTCFTLSVRVWLDSHFVCRWIGRRGPAESLPLPPGLTPCDWFLWDCAKRSLTLKAKNGKRNSRYFVAVSVGFMMGLCHPSCRHMCLCVQNAGTCVEMWH
jgi:hypothetical protein